ncbi:MAG: hypothetical protein JNM69_06185 [Archangium sp.]|nr:hypothetical protein [Archangium sp.]
MPTVNGKRFLTSQLTEIRKRTQIDNTLVDTDDTFVVSKPRMKNKTPEYKATELTKLAEHREPRDIAGVQKLDAPVKSVLLETKFSGDRAVDADTPIWRIDVK